MVPFNCTRQTFIIWLTLRIINYSPLFTMFRCNASRYNIIFSSYAICVFFRIFVFELLWNERPHLNRLCTMMETNQVLFCSRFLLNYSLHWLFMGLPDSALNELNLYVFEFSLHAVTPGYHSQKRKKRSIYVHKLYCWSNHVFFSKCFWKTTKQMHLSTS